MKIQTYSIITGSAACNANCPYCISRMTPPEGVESKLPEVNWRNFDIGSTFAKQSGVSTVLLTGKGEPTLFPKRITEYLDHLQQYEFPFKELQTHGFNFLQKKYALDSHLKDWYNLGMTTVAISVVHFDTEKNREIYTPGGVYPELSDTLDHLHENGFSIRMNCTMAEDYIDSIEKIQALTSFAKENKVEQLTIKAVAKTDNPLDTAVDRWVREHFIPEEKVRTFKDFLDATAHPLMELSHGAVVYDFNGQNICLNDCLSTIKDGTLRQLIFFPDGHLRYDWRFEGAILL